MTGAKVFSIVRYNEKIPGCTIVKHTKKRNLNDEIVYCAYYESDYVQFDRFLNRIKSDKTVIHVVQFNPDTGKVFDDPRYWTHQLMVHSNEEFDWEFDGWEQIYPSKVSKSVSNLWTTKYASKNETWDELINCIREDKEINSIVERLVPDKVQDINLFRMARNRRYLTNPRNKKRNNATVTKNGIRATKYEYPVDCVNKADRSKFRREQRKLNGPK